MKRKAIFFDIDGTLWDIKNRIPDSTKEAIHSLQKNGHPALLCSGRCRSFIRNPELLGIGFDGIISGCGTIIECGGETILYKKLEPELVEYTIRTVRSYGFRPILEGREYLYMDESEFGQDFYGKKLKAEMEDHLRSISAEWGKWEISKLSCATDGARREECFAALADQYDYMIHNEAVAEMVPKGYNKGTGITRACEYLGIALEDTFAFGDSVNDLDMFRAAKVAVAMGNGSEEAKAGADYVTASLDEDGIWKACRYFGLI